MYTGWPSSIPNLFARDTLHPLPDNPERVQALSDVPSWDLPFPYHIHQPSELLAQPSSLHLPLSSWSLLDCSVNVTINSSGLVRRNLPVTYPFLSLIVIDCDFLLSTWESSIQSVGAGIPGGYHAVGVGRWICEYCLGFSFLFLAMAIAPHAHSTHILYHWVTHPSLPWFSKFCVKCGIFVTKRKMPLEYLTVS